MKFKKDTKKYYFFQTIKNAPLGTAPAPKKQKTEFTNYKFIRNYYEHHVHI